MLGFPTIKNLVQKAEAAKKADKYAIKSAKLSKKSLGESNELKRSIIEKRAAKASFKSAKQRTKANRISKTAGYGAKAMKYSIKSDKLAQKAAKARMKMASNEAYIKKMKQKASALSEQEVDTGRNYVNQLLDDGD